MNDKSTKTDSKPTAPIPSRVAEITIHELTTNDEIFIESTKKFEKVKEIMPSRRGTHVNVKTNGSLFSYDGYLGKVLVRA